MPSVVAPPSPSARPSLATWLFVCGLGATVAAVLTCTLIIQHFVHDQTRQDATQFLQTNADALRDALDRGMAQNYEEVRVIGQLDQLSQGSDPVAIRRALEQMHASFTQFAWMGLAGRDGKVIASIDGLLQGESVAARPWFSGAQHGMFVGDVHRALLLEKLLPVKAEPWRFVDIATPVYASDGSLRGIFGAHLSWAWAAQIKHELVDSALQQHEAQALVVGTDGTVLLGTAGLQGKKLPPVDEADELSVESHTQGSGRYPGLGWNVVLRQPERVAMTSYRQLQSRMRVAALLLCLAMSPLLWLLARRLAQPLHELARRLDGTASGVPPRGRALYREAELLGVALDRYARRQQEDADHLRDLNASLEAHVAERTAALERANAELSQAVRERWQSQERLRAILTHAPDAYISIDESGRISEWNRQAEQTFGWTRDEAFGRTMVDLLTPVHLRDHHRTGLDAFTRGGGAAVGHRVELVVMHKTGVEIPVQLSAAALRTDHGQVAYAFLHDISERQHAQRLLAQSERRMRTVANNMPALVSHIDTDLRYTFVNKTYDRWFGLSSERVIGAKVLDVVGREAFEQVEPHLRRALAGEPTSFECDVAVNGRRMHNLIHYVPDIDETGAVQGVYGMVLDLTLRRDAEQARALSEQRLRAITDNLPVLISYIDREERYQFCNATYKEWFGIEPERIVGRTVADLLGEAEYQTRRGLLARALAGERVEFDNEAVFGRRRNTHTIYLPEATHGGAYVLVTDVTAMKAAEAELAHPA